MKILLAIPVVASFLQAAVGQQLGWVYPYDSMALSEKCLSMLNTTIPACSPALMENAPGPQIMYDILDSETLSEVCHERCYTSLKEFRAKVVSACNTEMDAVAFKHKNTIFPPTYMADLLLLSYEVYCYQDRDTGKFCDLQLAEWRNHRESDKPLRCEDCLLGPQRVQLQAPIGYDQDDADKFHDLTSSCSATGYEYATPTQYATGSTDCSGPGDHDDYVVVPRLHLPLE
ncbi:hypothetical protein NXS19_012498 [Fusarium pseudograminearum]|uniref:Uncharacterized protein n=1 Tax=Fusarium pseudograminearum (strain CS3096) TaxID=1028729 RepID=K3VPE1_FUSPC|nr:hypothetical protein FPSE_04164 [Fusarium pseudograminearum CS3096]EKJ75663.1 hypothetical protein FPSE_04164 [Fusarium pseudograminearum CS3096]UZP44686.1 hypothetical protein NXS19_012498 [Fusarium pseudograminearum]